jgi:hypothetical protein
MDESRLLRWSPLAGVVSVVLMIVAFALAGSSPDTSDPDSKIAAYLGDHSHQVKNIVAFFVFLAGVLFMLAFLASLRTRLVDAEPGGGRLGQFAFGAGVASSVLWIGAVTNFVAPLFAANDTSKFQHSADLYRLTQSVGYEFWVAAVVVGALVVWATSAVALRTGVLPRWFAWLGVLVGVINLLAVFFIPAFVYWGWIVVASFLLLRTRRPAATRPAALEGT